MPELILILLVALAVFGPKRFDKLGRGLQESLQEWRSGRVMAPPVSRALIVFVLGGVAFLTITAFAGGGLISGKQMIASLAVLAAWLVAGWYFWAEGGTR